MRGGFVYKLRFFLIVLLICVLVVVIYSLTVYSGKELIRFPGDVALIKYFDRDRKSAMTLRLTRERPFEKVKDTRVYLMSAIQFMNMKDSIHVCSGNLSTACDSRNLTTQSQEIVLLGWHAPRDRDDINKINITCCLMDSRGKLTYVKAKIHQRAFPYSKKKVESARYSCPVFQSNISYVSVTNASEKCDTNISYYIPVEKLYKKKTDELAICAKVIYGNIKPEYLIEWFEAQRCLGVDKIFLYLHANINASTKNVLLYYTADGLAETLTFNPPENGTAPRFPWEKKIQTFTDEKVAIHDCQERMMPYKYSMFVDLDELVLPANDSSCRCLKAFLNKTFYSSKLGVVEFKSKIHLLSWKNSSGPNNLFLEQHLMSTPAIVDRPKYAFIPDRVVPGACYAHGCPRKAGFKFRILTEQEAVVHHFRSCRGPWEKKITNETSFQKTHGHLVDPSKNGTLCTRFKQENSETMATLASLIRNNVLRMIAKIRALS